jgi:hypothetical protein
MDPSTGDMGDPWDHPTILASIDDLCSTHFRNTKQSVTPTNLIPGSTHPPTSTNLFSWPSSPNNTGSTAQATLEGARLLDKLKKGVDSSDRQKCELGERRSLPGQTPIKKGIHKRRQKVWKPKLRHPKLTLGMDVGLTEACNLALCALVGRLAYKEKCKQNLDAWITTHWKSLLGYIPKTLLLQQGWLGFIFRKPKDTVLILERLWAFDEGSLMLKRWRLGFNPSLEFFSLRHLWVLLPGLPLQLWNQQALEQIGASIGRFLRVDPSSLSVSDRRMARIYVEIDIQDGLPEILEIDWCSQLISQRLDYLGISFRCSLCRRTGHLRKDCYKLPPPVLALDPTEDSTFDGYISSPSQHVEEASFPWRDTLPPDDSVIGKIQHFCPSLYNTFTSWDRLFITEQADKFLFDEFSDSLPVKPDPPPHLPTPLPTPSEQVTVGHTPLPTQTPQFFIPTAPSSDQPSTIIEDTPGPSSLPGFSEPTQSVLQLDTMFLNDTPAPPLPYESLPIHTYHGKALYQPTPSPSDRPSSSSTKLLPGPDPTWSRGIGLELSPLKTRSARKKTQAGPATSGTSDTATNQGALRGLKALAWGKS